MNQKTNQGNYHEAITLREVLFNISDTSKKWKCTGYLTPKSLRIIGKPQNQNPVDESEYCLYRTRVEKEKSSFNSQEVIHHDKTKIK